MYATSARTFLALFALLSLSAAKYVYLEFYDTTDCTGNSAQIVAAYTEGSKGSCQSSGDFGSQYAYCDSTQFVQVTDPASRSCSESGTNKRVYKIGGCHAAPVNRDGSPNRQYYKAQCVDNPSDFAYSGPIMVTSLYHFGTECTGKTVVVSGHRADQCYTGQRPSCATNSNGWYYYNTTACTESPAPVWVKTSASCYGNIKRDMCVTLSSAITYNGNGDFGLKSAAGSVGANLVLAVVAVVVAAAAAAAPF